MQTLDVLRKLDSQSPAEVYIVGGYVRDLLRRKLSNAPDIDVVIRQLSISKLIRLLETHGHVKEVTMSNTNDLFDVKVLLFRAQDDEVEAQISLPRKGRTQKAHKLNTLKQDSGHRDFTMNALYLPINYTNWNDVIDIVGGIEDIRHKLIRAVGNPTERIKESPIRIVRAISLAARTGFEIDPALWKAMKDNVELLKLVPVEAFTHEFNEIILSAKPSVYIRLMHDAGILKIFIPELSACVGVTQENRYHKYDVFTHCVRACDNIKADLVLRLSALFHDIGKVDVREVTNEGKVTFHKHEFASTEKAYHILTRLKYDNTTRKEVTKLVSQHMYHYIRDFTDSAVRRFIRKAGVTKEDIDEGFVHFPLFLLRRADRLGNGFKKLAVTPRQQDFEERLIQVYRESNALDLKDLKVKGGELMSIFNLTPGPFIGKILDHLLEQVLETPNLNNKEALLHLALDFILSENQGATTGLN